MKFLPVFECRRFEELELQPLATWTWLTVIADNAMAKTKSSFILKKNHNNVIMYLSSLFWPCSI